MSGGSRRTWVWGVLALVLTGALVWAVGVLEGPRPVVTPRVAYFRPLVIDGSTYAPTSCEVL